MLYIVPTPIGNLSDITYRAVETLKKVSYILAEDTRVTGKLLKHYDIDTPLRAFHSHNEHKEVDAVLKELASGAEIALVSDAGTPGISDPGFLLARACQENQVPITCLPGATAIVPALVSSGIPCDKFYFEGFLPHKKGRQTRLKFLAELPCTFALYESPYRIVKCLQQLIDHCGEDRKASVCRELSKLYEEVTTLPLKDLLIFYQNKSTVKGEIVVVVSGK